MYNFPQLCLVVHEQVQRRWTLEFFQDLDFGGKVWKIAREWSVWFKKTV